jgi:hypothetical protein
VRIVGGHDYYDSALAYGHDDTVVLVRHKDKRVVDREIGLYVPRLRPPENIYTGPHRFLFDNRAVVIGEKLYAGVGFYVYNAPKNNRDGWGEPIRSEFVWSRERWRELLSEYDLRECAAHRYWNNRGAVGDSTFFEPRLIAVEVKNWMVRERAAILVTSSSGYSSAGDEWFINPDCLKDVGFPKLMDPYTLFQELDMWISGVLGLEGRPMVEVSNDTKIHKHGFDRFSFRKPKQNQ